MSQNTHPSLLFLSLVAAIAAFGAETAAAKPPTPNPIYEGDNSEAFYCTNPKGCDCHGDTCPKGAFCWLNEPDYDYSGADRIGCFFIDSIKNAQSAHNLFDQDPVWRATNGDVICEHCADYHPRIVFDKERAREGYLLHKKDEAQSLYVLCSKPGCDCNGVPLAKGYLCVKQHVVSAVAETETYGVCRSSYRGYATDRLSVFCDIGQDVVEQVCNRDGGCACGSRTIPKGDVCMNGKAQCSTAHTRPGCDCHGTKAEPGYGCLNGVLTCQAGVTVSGFTPDATCTCHGKPIHAGDICDKTEVICGADSRTAGCLCGGTKPLRNGYRCFQQKQECSCNGDNCTCKCGNLDISKGEICGDDDKKVVIPPPEVKKDNHGNTLTKCGAHWVDFGACHYAVTYVKTGEQQFTEIETDSPEDRDMLCTCGTGKPVPGDGYGCRYKEDILGDASERSAEELILHGWACMNPEGCKRGKSTEYPEICLNSDNDVEACTSKWEDSDCGITCDDENTLTSKDGNLHCGGHVLPMTTALRGYGCTRDRKDVPSGWYCTKPEGCACGSATCQKDQRCIQPGKCSVAYPTANPEYISIKKVSRESY